MNIYVSHSSSIEFEKRLYRPLERSRLSESHNVVFPHREEGLFDSKEFFKDKCDLVVAETSQPSTGLGIELGWADLFGIPIICVYEQGSVTSSSLKAVSENFIEYSSNEELISKLEREIDRK